MPVSIHGDNPAAFRNRKIAFVIGGINVNRIQNHAVPVACRIAANIAHGRLTDDFAVFVTQAVIPVAV